MKYHLKVIALFLLLLVAVSHKSKAQTAKLLLREYAVPERFLNDLFDENYLEVYAFKVRIKDVSKDKTTLKVLSFDPRRALGKRWEILSVDNQKPTTEHLKEAESMNKQDTAKRKEVALVDETKMVIEKETETEIVLGFKLNKAALPSQFDFADKIPGRVFLDKTKKQMSKVILAAREAFRVKVVAKIEAFSITNHYQFDDKNKRYQPKLESIIMKIAALGMDLSNQSTQEYFDYEYVGKK